MSCAEDGFFLPDEVASQRDAGDCAIFLFQKRRPGARPPVRKIFQEDWRGGKLSGQETWAIGRRTGAQFFFHTGRPLAFSIRGRGAYNPLSLCNNERNDYYAKLTPKIEQAESGDQTPTQRPGSGSPAAEETWEGRERMRPEITLFSCFLGFAFVSCPSLRPRERKKSRVRLRC